MSMLVCPCNKSGVRRARVTEMSMAACMSCVARCQVTRREVMIGGGDETYDQTIYVGNSYSSSSNHP